MTKRKFRNIISTFLLLLIATIVSACSKTNNSGIKQIGFNIINDNQAVNIYVEGENAIGSTSGDYPGVVRAAYDLQEDINLVTSRKPSIINSRDKLLQEKFVIIIGSIEKSKIIQELVENKKIDITPIQDKWESYFHQLVDNPFGDGSVKTALVIAGSDKRGTIYGIYKLSRMMGVSPWSYWADAVPSYQENYSLEKGYYYHQGEPTVQYRGIFINDEEELSQWSARIDNGIRMGPNVYQEIYELLLRLNANYLWPAMHHTSDAFNDHEGNRILADYYGIVIGTSHVDMMMRNNNNEWDNFVAQYKRDHNYHGVIEYDYTVNPEILQEYWRSAVRMYKDYEVQYSLGMRGKHDVAFTTANIDQAPWYGDKVKLLEQIIKDQRQILREELNNPTLEDVFMIFTPYKEVQEIYNQGLELPEDVTVLWVDDNHGFIRQLSNDRERARRGGSGVYFHNSYWGPDNESYMWLNSMPLTLMYEEMNKAIRYNSVKNWVLNVGDIKPGELPMEFFLEYAYRADKYNQDNVYEFVREWAQQEYGKDFEESIESIVKRYGQYTNVIKIEQIQVDLFTNVAYSDEYEKRMAKYQILLDDAEKVYEDLPAHKKPTFYQMILYQVRQAYYRNAEFYYATKANTAAMQGRSATAHNSYEMARQFYELSHYENSYYTKILSDGKWRGLMEPYKYSPPVASGFAESGATLEIKNGGDLIVEGTKYIKDNYELKFYNYSKGRKYIDVFNTGVIPFDFTANANQDWIKLSQSSGKVYDEIRVWVEIVWDKVPKGNAEGQVSIDYGYGIKTIQIKTFNDKINLGEKTYVEQDGYVSIEMENYSKSKSVDGAYFEIIKDLGRIEGDMVRSISDYLIGYSALDFQANAPYLEYNVHFISEGTFETEVYRFPSLDANGKIRFAIQVDDNNPIILEGENDYGVGNYDWEEGIFTQIFKHKFKLDISGKGLHRIRLYMIDPFLTFDKMVIYTEEMNESYLGPDESYNTTFNQDAYQSTYYNQYYKTQFLPTMEQDLRLGWGEGFFYEDGSLLIEVETAAEQSNYAYTTNPINDGWVLARNLGGYTMRTRHDTVNYLGQNEIAPTLNYQLYINKAGNYNVWFRYNAPMPSGDSFTLSVNGFERFRYDGLFSYNTEEVFVWRKVGVIGLANGAQTLNILANETGLILDKIYLTRASENPSNMEIKPAVRTSKAENLELKKEMLIALSLIENINNIPSGEKVGSYSQSLINHLYEKYNHVLRLYNQTETLIADEVYSSINKLKASYNNLIKSQNKVDSNKQNYVLYEDYGLYQPGLIPFGLKSYHILGDPNRRIYNDSNTNFLAIRTLYEQSLIQNADMYYEFENNIEGEIIVETRARFNEAIWGYVVYLQDSNRKDAIAIAFENSNGVNKNIVAYDGSTKRVIGKFELNEWVNIRVEANTFTQKFNVYLNDKLATKTSFNFRNSVSSFKYYKLGSTVVEANLNIEYIKVFLNNDYVITTLEEAVELIKSIPPLQKGMNQLVLPNIPSGFDISIKSSSLLDLIDLNGKIKIPLEDTEVQLVLVITKLDTLETADTLPINVLVPGVSSAESHLYLLQAISNAQKDINLIPVGNEVGQYSLAIKQELELVITEANSLLQNDNLSMDEVLSMETQLIDAYKKLFSSRLMTEVIDEQKYQYYAYEDFDNYLNGDMPYGIEYLPAGSNSASIVKDGDNGMYRLITGSSGQAYNRLDFSKCLSDIVVVEVGIIHSSTASNTFGNLIFLMSNDSTVPVASIAFDRPGLTTTLKYHDGSGWKTTKQIEGTNITYQPGEYAVIKAIFDLNLKSYQVYYNDILVYTDITFRNESEIDNISYLNFGTTKSNEEMYFDYIKVYEVKDE